MLYYVTNTNMLIPIVSADRIHNAIMMLFNLAFILITPVAAYSLYMANSIWRMISNGMPIINEIIWSPMSIIVMTVLTCSASFYILYKISQDIIGKFAEKINNLNKEITSRNNVIAKYNEIFDELERLNIGIASTELNILMEKMKNVREVNKLTINVELIKKMN